MNQTQPQGQAQQTTQVRLTPDKKLISEINSIAEKGITSLFNLKKTKVLFCYRSNRDSMVSFESCMSSFMSKERQVAINILEREKLIKEVYKRCMKEYGATNSNCDKKLKNWALTLTQMDQIKLS